MIKRRFYKQEHGDKDVPSDSSSSSSSDSDLDAEASVDSDDDHNNMVMDSKKKKDQPSSSSSGYESEDSSANEVNLDSSGSPTNEDDSEVERRAINGSLVSAENRFDKPIAQSAEADNDAMTNGVLDCVLKSKSVFKCKLCPRIVCLTEETIKAHLKSKRHARSEKLLKEGRLKMMLNSDGEIEGLEEDGETHQERHAATLALAESNKNATKKSKGRQRQRKRQKKKTSDDVMPNNTKSVKRSAKKRRKSDT